MKSPDQGEELMTQLPIKKQEEDANNQMLTALRKKLYYVISYYQRLG